MGKIVAAVPCADYTENNVRIAFQQVFECMGGLEWVRPGMKVGVKLNLCAAMKPEAAATTHPALAAELVRILREKGAVVVLGDSSGQPFTPAVMNHIYHVCEMTECEDIGGILNHNFNHEEVRFPNAEVLHSFEICSWLKECDEIISFSKLKAHGLMGMTAAVKNLYGVIPGTVKSEYHFRYPNPAQFANVLVDLNEYVHPRLCLCDAVDIMEGNGPTQGEARTLGLILASESPYELDRYAANLIGMKENEIPYLAAAIQRGLLPQQSNLTIPENYRVRNFKRSGATSSWFIRDSDDRIPQKIMKNALYLLMRSKPALGEGCIGCGQCMRECPAKAIQMKDNRPVIDRKKCIRCFCCQEFCLSGAMKVKRSPIAKVLGK